MASNWHQVYLTNPTTSLFNDDLLYLARAPYGVANDVVITIGDFKLNLFGSGSFHNVAPGNIVLTNPLATFNDCNTDGGASVVLPPMNADSSIAPGSAFTIKNTGSTSFSILAQDALTTIVPSVAPNTYVTLYLTSNLSANGTFAYYVISPSTSFTWNNVTSNAVSMLTNNGYTMNNGALVTLTLPATANVNDIIKIVGNSANGWSIAQNVGQTIHLGNVSSTTGGGGSVSSSNRYDCIELICTIANTDFVVRSSMGNLTIV